jgi:hypothetical protein
MGGKAKDRIILQNQLLSSRKEESLQKKKVKE